MTQKIHGDLEVTGDLTVGGSAPGGGGEDDLELAVALARLGCLDANVVVLPLRLRCYDKKAIDRFAFTLDEGGAGLEGSRGDGFFVQHAVLDDPEFFGADRG